MPQRSTERFSWPTAGRCACPRASLFPPKSSAKPSIWPRPPNTVANRCLSSGQKNSQFHSNNGFAVTSSHALNSLSSHRLCVHLANSLAILGACSRSTGRSACTPKQFVLLDDSATRLGRFAVTATPSRIRRSRTPPEPSPAPRKLHSALFVPSSCAHSLPITTLPQCLRQRSSRSGSR